MTCYKILCGQNGNIITFSFSRFFSNQSAQGFANWLAQPEKQGQHRDECRAPQNAWQNRLLDELIDESVLIKVSPSGQNQDHVVGKRSIN